MCWGHEEGVKKGMGNKGSGLALAWGSDDLVLL